MSFEKLLEDLEGLDQMNKALPSQDEDDENIRDAAGVDDDDDYDDDGEQDDPGGDNDKKSMVKSFRLVAEDGEEIEAFDGTEMLKSLEARVAQSEASTQKLMGGMMELMKSMQSQLAALSNQGRGRKAILTMHDKKDVGDLQKSQQSEGITPDEFMAKALQAQAEGKITGQDVARAEAYLNRGLGVPAEIVARVAAQ